MNGDNFVKVRTYDNVSETSRLFSDKYGYADKRSGYTAFKEYNSTTKSGSRYITI